MEVLNCGKFWLDAVENCLECLLISWWYASFNNKNNKIQEDINTITINIIKTTESKMKELLVTN